MVKNLKTKKLIPFLIILIPIILFYLYSSDVHVVSGQVTDAETGKPIDGATIRIGNLDIKTDESGNFNSGVIRFYGKSNLKILSEDVGYKDTGEIKVDYSSKNIMKNIQLDPTEMTREANYLEFTRKIDEETENEGTDWVKDLKQWTVVDKQRLNTVITKEQERYDKYSRLNPPKAFQKYHQLMSSSISKEIESDKLMVESLNEISYAKGIKSNSLYSESVDLLEQATEELKKN